MTKARSATRALTLFGLALGVTPALAESAWAESAKPASVAGPIVVDTAAAWTHTPTGVVLPPAIGSFTRTSVSQSEHGLADVSIGYDDNQTGTTLTVYVFRAGWPQAPLWADRLSQVMGMTVQRLGGTLAGTPRFTAFTPTGHASASGMRVVQGAQGGALLATGAVVIPAGAWLITMRMSSRKLDPAALDTQLAAAAATLHVPAPAKALPAATPIEACADTLAPPQAERAAPWDRHAILTGALLAATRNQIEPPKGKLPIGPDPRVSVLCRDPASTVERGLYRLPEDKQRYIIALGDAGVTIEAGPSVLAQIFKQPAMFDVTLSVFDKTAIYPPYASLPTPDQAMSALAKVKPEAEVGDDKNVTILE